MGGATRSLAHIHPYAKRTVRYMSSEQIDGGVYRLVSLTCHCKIHKLGGCEVKKIVLQRAKSEVLPGLEPGTFSVLTRCHDQLDHSTKLFLLLGTMKMFVQEASEQRKCMRD